MFVSIVVTAAKHMQHLPTKITCIPRRYKDGGKGWMPGPYKIFFKVSERRFTTFDQNVQ